MSAWFDERATVAVRTNFSIRRERSYRPHWLLYIDGTVAFRTRGRKQVIRLLVSMLHNLEVSVEPGRAKLACRAFRRDDAVVLIDHARPILVNDRELRVAGVRELPMWDVTLDAELQQLIVSDGEKAYPRPEIVGLVTTRMKQMGDPDLAAIAKRDSDETDRSLEVIGQFAEQGIIKVAHDEKAVRDAILSLLGMSAIRPV